MLGLRRASAWWYATGGLCGVALFYLAFVCTRYGQQVDAAAFAQLPELDSALNPALVASRVAVPVVAAIVGAVFAVVALARGQWRSVVSAVVVAVAPSLIAVVAKAVLPRPQLGPSAYAWNTFPSGHMAVTGAVLCAVVWLRPPWIPARALRIAALALGTAFGWALVLSYAHRPADVAGSALLTAAVIAVARATGAGRPWLPLARWRRPALAVGAGILLQFAALYVPGVPGLRFVGTLGTVLVIAGTFAAALLLVPSGREWRAPIQRLVLVGDARDIEFPRPK